MNNKEAIKYYNKLYKYCTTAKVHGKLYKERLKELQQLTVKELRNEVQVHLQQTNKRVPSHKRQYFNTTF